MYRGTNRYINIAVIVLLVIVIVILLVSRSGGGGSNPPSANTPGGGTSSSGSPGGSSGGSSGGSAGGSGSAPGSGGAPPPLGQRTKTEGCTANGKLQDRACTPGAIIASATKDQICVPGYSRGVRNVPIEEKDQVYAEYGIDHHSPGEYEVDHLVSLELGGSNEIANLWPEAASPEPGFHQKDRFENYMHDQVCSGAISLQEAQRRIAEDWLKYWQEAGQP
ncbi:MAG TPA: HNH endonuclease [Dehalococcoidia bacterium]|nr:HNH endonuclease [Dehalococcoidia bacterium]